MQADAHRTDGVHVAMPCIATGQPHLLDHTGRVGDRVGVRHGMHGSEPTERRCHRAGLDSLGVFATGLAQVRVQVDEARQRDEPVGVDDRRASMRQSGTDLADNTFVKQDVDRLAAADRDALEEPAAHSSSFVCSVSVAEARSVSAPIADSLPPSRR